MESTAEAGRLEDRLRRLDTSFDGLDDARGPGAVEYVERAPGEDPEPLVIVVAMLRAEVDQLGGRVEAAIAALQASIDDLRRALLG